MKRQMRRLAVILICVMLTAADMTPVFAAPPVAESSTVKSGLVKENGGYYFYVKNVCVRNKWKTVGGKKYYFGADGAAKTGWYTIKTGKKYKTYYFTSAGVLKPKKTKSISSTLVKKMDSVISRQKIAAKTTDAEKVSALFDYCKKTFRYKRAAGTKLPKNWSYSYAQAMLTKKKGSCYHDAAAFAFLVRRATGLPVKIVTGTSNVFNKNIYQKHAWVLVKLNGKWLVYDVNGMRYSKTGYAANGLSEKSVKAHYRAEKKAGVLL